MHPGSRNHPYGTEKQDRDADKFPFTGWNVKSGGADDDSSMVLSGLLSLIAGAGFVGLFIRRRLF